MGEGRKHTHTHTHTADTAVMKGPLDSPSMVSAGLQLYHSKDINS
jgi:hypothetical protein